VKFGHAVSHCQWSKIYPKLPKSAHRQLVQKTLKFHQKLRFWFSSKKKTSTCRGGTKAWAHHLDFQSKNFPNAFFNVKKRPMYVNFSIPLCAKWHFIQGSIHLMVMRFCWHVPNSHRNKNLKSLSPYLLYKMVFWPPKLYCTPWAHGKKLFFQLWTLWSCKLYRMNV
jgi:hypothetical protein